MEWVYDDGGRSQYFKTMVGDCVTRAVAIATGKDYKEVYNTIKKIVGYTPRNGVYKKDTKKVMEYFGGKWKACMGMGTGCQVHLTDSELPYGTIICNLSHHVVCVKDGVIHDNHDPSRNDGRCVYGYWKFEKEHHKITYNGTIMGDNKIKATDNAKIKLSEYGFKEGEKVKITIETI